MSSAQRHMNGCFTTNRLKLQLCNGNTLSHRHDIHASCHNASQTRANPHEMWHFLALAVGKASGPRTLVNGLQKLRLREARKLSPHIAPFAAVQSTSPMHESITMLS